jgi:hypothetical protein
VNSIFRGYVTSQACSGTAEHSLTTQVHYRGHWSPCIVIFSGTGNNLIFICKSVDKR